MSIKKTIFPYYQVKENETLEIIAKKTNIDPISIILNNNISPLNIKDGTFLKIKK